MSTMTSTSTRSTESRYKKSTSREAPIQKQDYGTTPEQRSHAEILFARIGTGKAHAVKRPRDRYTDRAFRKLIEEANKSGDCIINVGEGYFRPGEDDEQDLMHYLNAELRRAKEINDKADAMREAYYGRY